MLEVFGVNGLDRLLALEDQARRADAAKVIEGEVVDAASEDVPWDNG
jgi:hypothetical protein